MSFSPDVVLAELIAKCPLWADTEFAGISLRSAKSYHSEVDSYCSLGLTSSIFSLICGVIISIEVTVTNEGRCPQTNRAPMSYLSINAKLPGFTVSSLMAKSMAILALD